MPVKVWVEKTLGFWFRSILVIRRLGADGGKGRKKKASTVKVKMRIFRTLEREYFQSWRDTLSLPMPHRSENTDHKQNMTLFHKTAPKNKQTAALCDGIVPDWTLMFSLCLPQLTAAASLWVQNSLRNVYFNIHPCISTPALTSALCVYGGGERSNSRHMFSRDMRKASEKRWRWMKVYLRSVCWKTPNIPDRHDIVHLHGSVPLACRSFSV